MTRQARLLAACLFIALPCAAQQVIPPLNDPANLAGERVSPPALADDLPVNHGAAALQQLLLKLRTRASMMMIVAHPDDEDGGFLTYESRGQGARVAMLTLTRGEGGQNLMSGDFNDALGLIRTQELLAADRYLGVDQMFGTEVDFGFSKTKEEALKQWGYDRVLYDAVRAVRLYRPLVLASVFVGGPTDGHGHHQVAGEISQEVFKAAADPNVFPEMIHDGLLPWTPLKVYARAPFARITAQGMFDYATGKWSPPKFHNYVTGVDIATAPKATVTINEGAPAMVDGKPALGMDGLSYVQFARKGLALQKTQIGPGVRTAPAGRADVGYTLMGSHLTKQSSAVPATESSLFEGIDTSLPAIADLAPDAPAKLRADLTLIDGKIAEAQTRFDPAHLEATAEPLLAALGMVDTLISDVGASSMASAPRYNVLHELRIKRVQLDEALVLALGVSFRAYTRSASFDATRPSVEVRTEFTTKAGEHLNCRIISVGPTLLDGEKLTSCSKDPSVEPPPIAGLAVGRLIGGHFHIRPLTRPYFSRPNLEQPFYTIADPALRNAPATPPQFVRYEFGQQGVRLDLAAAVESAPEHEAASNPREAVAVVPPVVVSVQPTLGIVTPADRTVALTAFIGGGGTQHGDFRFTVPKGWQIEPRISRWSIDHPEAQTTSSGNVNRIPLTVRVPADQVGAQRSSVLNATATFEKESYSESYRAVGYPGLTHTNMYTPATFHATAVEVTTAPQLKVAYVPGTGDEVAAFLPSLGVTPTILKPADLNASTLAKFDTVVLGVRAYAAHPELTGAGSKPLNDFAAAGGVVIVQYNTGSDATGTAPYPFNLPGDQAHNVVEEQQPVRVIAPDAPLLNWPNKITAADFDHWIEERGHGFASTWALEYQPLLEMHDPGQDPQEGGLLVAKVGKGAYIYCALALYRQLPEGVPGAYRLTANLLSYGKNPKRP